MLRNIVSKKDVSSIRNGSQKNGSRFHYEQDSFCDLLIKESSNHHKSFILEINKTALQ